MKARAPAIVMAALMAVLTTTALSAQQASPETPDAAVADKKMLQQAFDGAMTCSAITAILADGKTLEQRWQWDNRSFAFGMLAARFWHDATGEQMTGELLDRALNQYAGKITELEAERRAGFEKSCASKYADVDKLCEINDCLHKGPPALPPPALPKDGT